MTAEELIWDATLEFIQGQVHEKRRQEQQLKEICEELGVEYHHAI